MKIVHLTKKNSKVHNKESVRTRIQEIIKKCQLQKNLEFTLTLINFKIIANKIYLIFFGAI